MFLDFLFIYAIVLLTRIIAVELCTLEKEGLAMRFNHNRSGMKRLVAYMLILAMLLTIMPVSAFAKKAPKLRLPGVPAAAEAPAEAPEAPAEPEAPAAEEATAELAAPEAPPAPEEAAAPEAPAAPEEPAEPESPAIVQ